MSDADQTSAGSPGHKVTGNDNITIGDISNAQNVTIQVIPGAPQTSQPTLSPDPLPPPGALPEPGLQRHGWYLPISRNAVFTGRAADLLALADALLHHPQPGVTAISALKGEGGIGKSQLAVEFAYRYGRFFHAVHWIPAGDTGDVASGIAACGEQMALPGWPDRLPEQTEATLRAWAAAPQRLLILDNLEDPEKLRPWLPKIGMCRLLITTRRGNWPAELGVRAHALGVLPLPEARDLLRKLAPRLEKTSDGDLNALSNHLGGLPLAIDLAGRYLEEVGTLSASDYLKEIQSKGSLKHPSLVDWTHTTPTQHAPSLAATFELSWNRLDEQNTYDALARRIFYAAGYCAPNAPIPPELLQQAVEAEDAPTFARALRRLSDLGLLRAGAPEVEIGPSLHPLLAEFARLVEPLMSGAAPDTVALAGLAEALIELSNAAFKTGLPGPWQPLRAHLEAAAPLAEAAGLDSAGTLWNELGQCLEQFAQYPAARDCYTRALVIAEQVFGKENPIVATFASNLGLVLQALGDLAGAKVHIERALAIDEQIYGRKHPTVAIRASNLGLVLRDLGDLAGAQAHIEYALAIAEQVYGRDHPTVAIRASNLGLVMYDLGDLVGAKAHIERALAIDEQAYGREHPYVATHASNLGMVLKGMGDLAGARAHIERALAIAEQIYGQHHPDVANLSSNLGIVLHDLGDLVGARAHIERALAIDEQVYGKEHPNVATHASNLGMVLKDLGDLAGARVQIKRALDIDEQAYGQQHPNMAIRLVNLSALLRDLGDLSQARVLLQRALAIFTRFLPPEHSHIQNVRVGLKIIEREMGER